MSRIQSPPRGLQDLLGTQNFGQNPNELSQTVVPVVNMGNFYQLDKTFTPRQTVNFPVSPGVQPGDRAVIEVPAGQMWYVWKLSAAVSNIIGAGQEFRSRCFIELNQRSDQATNQDAFLLDKEIDHVTSGSSGIRDYFTQNYDLGLWFPSGTQFFHEYLEGDDPGCNMAIMALAARLTI